MMADPQRSIPVILSKIDIKPRLGDTKLWPVLTDAQYSKACKWMKSKIIEMHD